MRILANRAPRLVESPAQAAIAEEVTVAGLVKEFSAARTSEERADIARSIAAQDAPESLGAIIRLFAAERVPLVKEALVAGLGDLDKDDAVPAKVAFLASALKGQPRNVRSAALGVLAIIDTPAARVLIRGTAKQDSDHEIREEAKSLAEALE